MRHAAFIPAAVVAASAAASEPLACPEAATVSGQRKISDTAGGFDGRLSNNDSFGSGLAAIGDLDADGVPDLAVGAPADGDGGFLRGAVWILFLDEEGGVRAQQKVSDTAGGFEGRLANDDLFGVAIASLGDLDGDGVGDLAVGAQQLFEGLSLGRGAVWILFMNADGTVRDERKIAAGAGGFTGNLNPADCFGCALAGVGDLDGDGRPDLAVGAPGDDTAGQDAGAIWLLTLTPDGAVKTERRITKAFGGFSGALDESDAFGSSIARLGSLGPSGLRELAVGAPGDDDGDKDAGAVWILSVGQQSVVFDQQKISMAEGGFMGELGPGAEFGCAVARLGDLDGTSVTELGVGAAPNDPALGAGSVWVLSLSPDGAVEAQREISKTVGGFVGDLEPLDQFGAALAALGDLDGDGVVELSVGAPGDDDGGTARGAVWTLFLDDGRADGGCPGDIIRDDAVDSDDLNALLSHFGDNIDADCRFDLDGSGLVDAADLNVLLLHFGTVCQ